MVSYAHKERETMSLYIETQEAVLEYALEKAGEERYKYAYAFGMVYAILTKEQQEYLKKFATNGVSNAEMSDPCGKVSL